MSLGETAYFAWKGAASKQMREQVETVGRYLLQAIKLHRSADTIVADFLKMMSSYERNARYVLLFAAAEEARYQSKAVSDRERVEEVLDQIESKALKDPFAMQSYQQMMTNLSNYYRMLSNIMNAQAESLKKIAQNFR